MHLGALYDYKGCTFHVTQVTTSVGNRVRNTYRVRGRFSKSERETPFLTSARACREWINEQILMREGFEVLAHEERDE